jgi:DNA-binding response OmpR family regulator
MKDSVILIIEDDADIREGIRILLESENYLVREAENGKKGLSMLNEEIDLVILDVMMPGMSGLKTCEEIRKISYVPVLFLTAKSSESDKLIGLMAGGDDYLAKPFSYAELLGRVKALLRRYQIYQGKTEARQEYRKMYFYRLAISELIKSIMRYG